MAEIQSLSNKHHAILEHMMANPHEKLGDVARKFDVTQGWLSQIVHSDAFQRQLAERQDQTFNSTVLPLREKMNVVAHKMLDRLIDANADNMDVDTVNEVATDMLDRMGFSPKTAQNSLPPAVLVQVNIEREKLAAARSLIGRPAEPTLLEDTRHETLLEAPREPNRVGGVSFPRAISGALAGEDGGAETGTSV